MRYAIGFTPSVCDPLTLAAAEWLGRNPYSDALCEQPHVSGISAQELAFYTAVPRRFGFHAMLRPLFRLGDGVDEAALLNALLRFTSERAPLVLPRLSVRLRDHCFMLAPAAPSEEIRQLTAEVLECFEPYRAMLTDAEIERRDPDRLTATQFANLHRWGDPHVMDEHSFHMMVTGPVPFPSQLRIATALQAHFEAFCLRPLEISSLALFVEAGAGAPMRVHSQLPMGKLPTHRVRPRTIAANEDGHRPAPVGEAKVALAMRSLVPAR
ncbi:hypothetical protein BJF93_12165 [Xaviernesmea oryzae]|uniref:DUF1045 domain-containing protein n=1 Tax=Xaviernesmea oryzae TaxID=464029 RepID=A0A1Q9AVH7_9HYPH|nr:DUF1045 domain-containing protein [Xaviernesmea oryzae]OLP59460.1 hypothetical protein BJF93_12165 [Xaviernesmea oryzae]SEL59253.1 Protein of unknown function [Xaviernesmea oryzae]